MAVEVDHTLGAPVVPVEVPLVAQVGKTVRAVHRIEAEMRLAVHEVPHTEAEMHFAVDV